MRQSDSRPLVSACLHEDIAAEVAIRTSAVNNIHNLRLSAHCRACGAKMKFLGMLFGNSPNQPTMTQDGLQANIPLLVSGEKPSGDLSELVGTPIGRGAR